VPWRVPLRPLSPAASAPQPRNFPSLLSASRELSTRLQVQLRPSLPYCQFTVRATLGSPSGHPLPGAPQLKLPSAPAQSPSAAGISAHAPCGAIAPSERKTGAWLRGLRSNGRRQALPKGSWQEGGEQGNGRRLCREGQRGEERWEKGRAGRGGR